MEYKKLKSCPFCGGKADIQEIPGLGHDIRGVRCVCENCGASGKMFTYGYMSGDRREAYDAAEAQWNNRTVAITESHRITSSEFLKINPYREYVFRLPLEKWVEAVEKALGFKLFFWQKTFIESGVFRCFGKTTAEILRDLSQVNEAPLDLRKYRGRNMRERVYYDGLLRVKAALDAAEVPTREVWLCDEDRRKWMQRQKEESTAKAEAELRPLGKFWDV